MEGLLGRALGMQLAAIHKQHRWDAHKRGQEVSQGQQMVTVEEAVALQWRKGRGTERGE